MLVTIRNFQSLQLVEIEVDGLTVMVGPSDIGKSALIRAVSSAFFHRPGDDFVRRGASSTSVEIIGAPKVGGGTFNVEWHKGAGLNRFVIDGAVYDKVARETPVHLPKYGYHDIQVGDDFIRPQVSEQWSKGAFLIDRSGSFIHDVIAQASRLSVLLRADRACGTDLKRQRSLQKIRIGDLDGAREKLESMSPVIEFHARVQAIKPKLLHVRQLSNRLEDLQAMGSARSKLKPVVDLRLPSHFEAPHFFRVADLTLEVKKLTEERNRYTHLPQNVPSAKKYDFEGMIELSAKIEEAKNLARSRFSANGLYRDAQSALRSVKTELEASEAALKTALDQLQICPVCDRPMPGKEQPA